MRIQLMRVFATPVIPTPVILTPVILILALLITPALAQEYRPPRFVLYGHGQGGDGLGYGFQNGYVSQNTHQYFAKPQTDAEPWGRYDNTAPGYRSHGFWMSHPFYGRVPTDPSVTYVGAARIRGRHETTLSYDRFGKPVYTYED